MRPVQGVNLTDRTHKANPFPFYAYLRWASPVHTVTLPGGRSARLVTRYDDVAAVLADRRFAPAGEWSERGMPRPWMPRTARPLSRSVADLDESTQARFGALVAQVVTPARLDALRDRVTLICHRHLWGLRESGQVDLVADYARPVPMMVTAEILGVPPDDWPRIVRWLTAIASPERSAWRGMRSTVSEWRCLRYADRLIRAHKAEEIGDPLGLFAEAADFGLTDQALVHLAGLLLSTGFEIAANLIANGLETLLQHPHQLARLRGQYVLMAPAIEELARFTSPVEIAPRVAGENLSAGGVDIASGDLVLAAIASANRDHRQFPDPDVLDLGRAPNQHLSFSDRPRGDLAAPLARLVGQVAIWTLLQSAEFLLERDASRLRWQPGLAVRGLESLPVRIVRWSA